MTSLILTNEKNHLLQCVIEEITNQLEDLIQLQTDIKYILIKLVKKEVMLLYY